MHYFASILVLKSSWSRVRKAYCFAVIVWQMFCYYKCSLALLHGAVGLSAVCDCGISWSYSLTFERNCLSELSTFDQTEQPLWISLNCGVDLCVIYVLCMSCIAALWPPAGNGWPLGSCLWWLIVFLELSHMVSLVRCVTWLYRFLIDGAFLTTCVKTDRISESIIIVVCRPTCIDRKSISESLKTIVQIYICWNGIALWIS